MMIQTITPKRKPYPERYNRLFDDSDPFTAAHLEIPSVGDLLKIGKPSSDGQWAAGVAKVLHVVLIDEKLLVTVNTGNKDRELINEQWVDFISACDVTCIKTLPKVYPTPDSAGLPKSGEIYTIKKVDPLNRHLLGQDLEILSVAFFDGLLMVTAQLVAEPGAWEEMQGGQWYQAVSDLNLTKKATDHSGSYSWVSKLVSRFKR